ncbi:MAG: GxxExxY protein [Phycisphaerales bacterium]|nr:GxxExxY protein [Phycisphaerales bacterium]
METDGLTERIIGCAYAVHNALGPGFLEKVYENALAIELTKAGLHVVQQHPIAVRYRGRVVGDFLADLIVEDRIIVEPKAGQNPSKEHEVQLVNYLTATEIDNGLLIHFGPSVEVKRKSRTYRKPDRNAEKLGQDLQD